MNLPGFNQKNPAIDSAWSYHLGQGFTQVHVEFESNKCHIQLIKLSLWEKVANFFLNLIHQEIKPKIEDKIITYPKEQQFEVDKKIENIKNQIFELQKKGYEPERIRNVLYEEGKALAASIAFQEQSIKQAILEAPNKESEADERAEEQSTQDQAFARPEDHPTDTPPKDSGIVQPDILASEEKPPLDLEDSEEDVGNASEENAKDTNQMTEEDETLEKPSIMFVEEISPPESNEISINEGILLKETDLSIASYMKYLGFGLLATAGIAIASYLFKDSLFSQQPAEQDFAPLLKDNIKILNLQLSHYRADIPTEQYVELHANLNEVTKSIDLPQKNMEQAAIKVDAVKQKVEQFIQEIPPKPNFETQLTILCESTPESLLSKEQLISLVGPSYGGHLPKAFIDDSKPFISETAVSYLKGCLKLMGINPEEKKIANALAESLSSYSEIEKQFLVSRGKFQQNFKDLEQEKLLPLWQKELSAVKEVLSEHFIHGKEKGFFLNVHKNGEILHFFPERSNKHPFETTWTIRYYFSEPQLAIQPFNEIRGLKEYQILNDDTFLTHLILSEEDLSHPALNKFAISESEILKRFSESGEKPHFLHPHDFLLNFQSPLNNILFVELGPEAYLDVQLSTIHHFINHNQKLLVNDPALYTLLKHTSSSLAYAVERASALKTIDPLALQEKSRILRDIGYKLRVLGIKNEKRLLKKAPIVDESTGQRKIAQGKIPTKDLSPLRKLSEIAFKSQNYRQPIVFSKKNIPLPKTGTALTLDEIAKLPTEIHTKAGMDKFRSWSAAVLLDSAILKSLNVEEATQVLGHLADMTKKLENSPLDNPEVNLAIVEAVAVADRLLNIGHFTPQEAHLPLHELVNQLKSIGGISQNSISPELLSQAEKTALSDPSKLIFNESILQRDHKILNFEAHWRLDQIYERDRYKETGGVPWDLIRQLSLSDPDLLPAHIKNAVPKDEFEAFKAFKPVLKTASDVIEHAKKKGSFVTNAVYNIVNHYHKEHEKGALKSILEIVTNQARLQARIFTIETKKFADQLTHLSSDPQVLIDAVQSWSKIYSPSALNRNLLEVLTPEQRLDLLNSFGQIAQSLQTANFQAAKLLPDPETMITHLELITMADQVMAYSTDNDLTRFHLPLDLFSEIILGNHPFFRTFDPFLENDRMRSIAIWLNERTNINQSRHYNPLFTEFPGYYNPNPRSIDSSTSELAALLTEEKRYDTDLQDYRDGRKENLINIGPQAFANPNYISPESQKSIPSWYANLRELTHSALHVMRSGFINPLREKSNSESFHAKYTLVKNDNSPSGKPDHDVKYQLKDITPEDLGNYPEIPDGFTRGHQFSHHETQLPKSSKDVTNELRDARLKPANNYLPGIDKLSRSIYDIDVAMAKETHADTSYYSSEDYRIKWSLRANSNLQTFLTISTYLEHPEWLIHPKEQIEFFNLLFNADLLIKHLQEGEGVGPKAEAELAKFIHTQYRTHANKPELQVFFAEAGLRLSQYSAVARKTAPLIYQNLPIPSELEALANLPKKMFERKGLSEAERSSYASLYALSFLGKSEFTKQEIINFYQAMLAYRSDSPVKMVNIYHVDRQINNLAKQLEPELIKLLYPADNQLNQELLTETVGKEINGKSPLVPAVNHPLIFMDREGTVEVNLHDGSIIQAGKEGIPVPMEARHSQVFKMIHGQSIYRGKSLDRHTFQFDDDQGFTNIMQKNGDEWLLYRKLDESETPFQSVTAHWMEWNPSTRTNGPIQWLKSQAMLSQHTHWHRGGNNPEIRLLDSKGKLAFRVELSGNGQDIKKIVKASSSGDELVLADIEQSTYDWCRQFEDSTHVHAWISPKTGQGQQIEFLRAGMEGIRFSLKNNKWHLDSAPQYAVARHQIHPIFPGQTNFLLLETDAGAQRLLIPRAVPNAKNDIVDLSFERNSKSLNPQRILTLDKNPKTGKFESQDIETNAYLAMLNTGHRNYHEARNLLGKIAADQKGLFPKEIMETLDWIIDGSRLPSDQNPQIIAIRTYAAQIKADNIETNSKREEKENDAEKIPKKLQNQYLKHIHGLAELRMPPADEAKLFLQGIESGNLPAPEAIAALQITDPALARQLVDAALKQRIFKNAAIDFQAEFKPRETIPTSLSTQRMPVIAFEELESLVDKKSLGNTSQNIPKEMEAIFDDKSEWFSKLPSPIQDYFKKIEGGVRAFQKERDHHEYELKDLEKFHILSKRLETEQYDLSIEMERLRFKMLDLANTLPQDPQQAQQHLLKMEAGTVKPVAFEELVEIFIKGDLNQYQNLNPYMRLDQARQIDQDLQTFIDMVPEWQYRQRLIAVMKTVEKTTNDPVKHQAALKNFFKASQADRQFPHDAKRQLKVMEYHTGSYYHAGQIDKLGKLGFPGLETSPTADAEEQSAVHRITVGAGKTSRLLPSMLKHYAEEGKLALAIMPEAQLASAGKELAYIMKDVYQIPTFETEFSLKTSTVEFLEKIVTNLEEAIKNGHPVLTSGKSIRVLRNLYIENKVMLISKKDIHDLSRKVDALEKIVEMISVTPIIDEAEELNPRRETNHVSGEAFPLHPVYGAIAQNLYEILSDNDIQSLMHFNFINQDPIKGAKPFSQERFKTEIAPLLAKKMLQRLENPQQIDALSKFYQGLNKERKEDVQNYLLKNSSSEVIDWIEQKHEIRDQLALIRGELNVLLPLTLNRKFGERYGFANENDVVPIPFSSAGMPNIGSQFSLPYERYNYLIQALTHDGLRKPLYQKIIRDLQSERHKELTELTTKGMIPEIGEKIVTKADQEFERLFKTDQWNLDTPDVADKLYKQSAHHPETFRHLIETYALQQIKVFPRNLKATSQHLGNMFPNYHLISGTPSDYGLYPGYYLAPQDEAVVGRMLTLMAEHTFGKTHTLQNPKEILNHEIVLRSDAIMDAAGLLARENLEEIGDAWSIKTGKAVVRVDQNEGIIIKQSPHDKAVSIRASTIPPEQRVALMGQSDIIGTDIVHKPNALGVVSVSATSTLSIIEQAAGRMRGIESGQSVEFLVLEDDAILIREALGLATSHQLSSQDILKHLIINEAKKQMEDSEVALRHKLQAVIDNFVFNWLRTNDAHELANKQGISEFLEAIFFPTNTISPFELFGREETALPKEKAFAQEIEKLVGPHSTFMQKATPVFGNQMAEIAHSLKNSMEAIVDKQLKYINEMVVFKAPTDMEQQQEMLQEQNVLVEQSQEQNQETEVQQEKIEQSSLLKTPIKHKHWVDAQTFELNKETIASSIIYEKGLSEGYLSRLPDVFSKNDETKILANLFENDLLVSCNFQQDVILKAPQKPAQFALIAFNKIEKKHKLVFIDPKEAFNFKQAYYAFKGDSTANLHVDPIETSLLRVIKKKAAHIISVYYGYNDKLRSFNVYEEHTDLDVNKPSSQPVEQDTEIWVGDFSGLKAFGNDEVFDLKKPEFAKLWAQAQIFAGRFNFDSDEERTLIQEWLNKWSTEMSLSQDKPKAHFLNAAENAIKKIISSKEDVLINYPKTDLGKIFAKLKLN